MAYRVEFPQQSSGAMDFSVGEPLATGIPWSQLCDFIPGELSRDAGEVARELWDRFHFELRDGTNYFDDEFAVLCAQITREQYLELQDRKPTLTGVIRRMVRVIERVSDTNIRFVCFEFNLIAERRPEVDVPAVVDTAAAVREALQDVQRANREGRPLSAVDRVYTAFHGHLLHLLTQEGIVSPPDSVITFLFRELRTKHPAFSAISAHQSHIRDALNGLAKVVDSLSPIRNRGSIAHPNEDLLEEPEAALFVDATKSLFSYVERRMDARRTTV